MRPTLRAVLLCVAGLGLAILPTVVSPGLWVVWLGWLGISLLAMYGYGGGPVANLDVMSFILVIVGAGTSGLLPSFSRKPAESD